jgi:hypothetical protein
MRVSGVTASLACLAGLSFVASAAPLESEDPIVFLQDLQKQATDSLEAEEANSKRDPHGCSLRNAVIRRDW